MRTGKPLAGYVKFVLPINILHPSCFLDIFNFKFIPEDPGLKTITLTKGEQVFYCGFVIYILHATTIPRKDFNISAVMAISKFFVLLSLVLVLIEAQARQLTEEQWVLTWCICQSLWMVQLMSLTVKHCVPTGELATPLYMYPITVKSPNVAT